MKYLLLLLLTINTSFAVCSNKTIVEVNECLVNDRLLNLLQVVRPSFYQVTQEQYVEDSVNRYYFTDEATYENLIIDPLLPLSELQTALDSWKSVEIIRLTYWNSLDSIGDIRTSMVKCNLNQPNSSVFTKDLKTSLDQIKLDCLVSKQTEIATEKAEKEAKDLKIKEASDSIKTWDCAAEKDLLKLLCEAAQE